MSTLNAVVMAVALIALTGAVPVCAGDAGIEARIAEAATGEHREPGHAARNSQRHPVETLAWFGLREDMTVVEIWPGGEGWYTEILAPVLREHGKLFAANYAAVPGGPEYYERNAGKFAAKLAARPDIYDRVVVTALMPPHANTAAPPGGADMVLTFRNLHNWIRSDVAAKMFAAMYAALKPGGVLGLVAHRAAAGSQAADPGAEQGYVTEDRAIALAGAAGFELVARSEINANPADSRAHPDGVWSLAPTFRSGDEARYAPIGESDRMTLKFVKPGG
ncbi:MAG: class I SAM-dependent methyltransferase [Gammaproteobacteria bacterium]|nr:class I SAM-dependent methyltransferase [Gammaproteobacteria bacterium]